MTKCSRCGTPRERGKKCKPCRNKKLRKSSKKRREAIKHNPVFVQCPRCGGQRIQGRHCLACRRPYMRAYVREYAKAIADREKDERCLVCGSMRARGERCRTCLDRYQAEYRLTNAAKRREYAKKRYYSIPRDPQKEKERKRAWRMNNPIKALAEIHRRRERKINSDRFGCFTESEWDAIIKRQRGKCAICGKKRKLTIDHIIPISKGGSNLAINIQGACFGCNASKRDRILPGTHASLFDTLDSSVKPS